MFAMYNLYREPWLITKLDSMLGDDCREFRHEWTDARGKGLETGLACRSATGDWPYLTVPALRCVSFHARSSVNDVTGAASPSSASQRLKSRFMPYL